MTPQFSTTGLFGLALGVLLSGLTASAATLHVWQASPSPTPPHTTWATAAHTIQDAVDAAHPADTVLVTNGMYATGGRAVVGTMTNRLVIDKAITVQSVNGPEATLILGAPAPGGTNGDGAVRCVYLADGAALSGFTLTHGATRDWQGDYEQERGGGGVWCESTNALVTNCTLTDNSAGARGGGACSGTLNHCTLTGNSVTQPYGFGGGAYGSSLNNCTLTGNSAYQGAGAARGMLNNCTLTGNLVTEPYGSGGGAAWGMLNNCTLTGNAASYGGGAYYGTLNNCTLTGNLADYGGGALGCTLNNCIVYYNTAHSGFGSNYDYGTLNYCCTTPLAPGEGNLDADPQLASAWHLSAASPCIGAGSPAYAMGTDIDGEAWGNPPSIGCDEYWFGAVTGLLSVEVTAAWTNVAAGYAVDFRALIEGRASASAWDFGGGVVVSNRPYASHAWSAPGAYAVVLRAWNPSHPGGVSATVTVQVVEAVHYVAAGNTSPGWPFASWATAATTIQDAVDAAAVPGALVLVSNGVYATGGRAVDGLLTNRVAVDKPLTVRSVNGPEVTVIEGHQVPGTSNGSGAIRCAYLTNGAVLSGFTLSKGATRNAEDYGKQLSGGGVWCESRSAFVTNCTLTGNSATWDGGAASGGTLNNCLLTGNSAAWGGGASGCTLNHCLLTGNMAQSDGGGASGCTLNNCMLTGNSARRGSGGASDSTLNNCTVTGNSATWDGGASESMLNNCIVYFNKALWGPTANYDDDCILSRCCTVPLAPGEGNIDADPQLASASHLSAASPCIGAGSRAYATGTDIDGEDWSNPPSIGCDEYRAGSVTGPLRVEVVAAWTNVAVGYAVDFRALIEGRANASAWDFGGGEVLSNRPYASHAWPRPGAYTVELRAWNESHPGGVSATVTVQVGEAPVHYVALGSASPAWPYASWSTAATNIQDAVDAATVPGALVLVSNGVYATGGRAVYGMMTNRVVVDKPLTVRSLNGPEVTVIEGYQVPGITNGDGAIRCVYLGSEAVLRGFTLTNGATRRTGSWDQEETGGGVWSASASALVNHCTLTGNSAGSGGGAAWGTLNNCLLTGNAASYGGGAYGATLNHCTLTGNSAGNAGGASWCTLNNCILYYNTAYSGYGPNYDYGTINYCCTTPLASGEGNLDADPQLASASHLSAASPCIGAGSPAYATGTDIDSEAWGHPPSIGCDEYRAGAVTGPLKADIVAAFTNVASGYSVDFTALIAGRTTASAWDFGDGVVASNRPYASHAWSALGAYAVVLRAWNESHPGGVSATVTVQVVEAVHYAAAGNTSPAWPFASWATAATTIQEAVDAAAVPGALVLVSNGVYATGGRAVDGTMTNRVAVDKPMTVRSVNGPEVTVIEGYQVPGTTNWDGAVRCVYLGNGAVLSGFTLTRGATRYWQGNGERERSGGGVWCEGTNTLVTNCTLTGNSACALGGGAYSGTLNHCTLTGNSASYGGGACWGTLNHCTIMGNSADRGGGATDSTLYHCTVAGNSATDHGGGAGSSTLHNCIVYFNTAPNGPNYSFLWGTEDINYSCTTTLPTNGTGNLTNAPAFVDLAAGNLRLQSNSPCINAGHNAYTFGETDLDGLPRIVGGTVDMGAYEFQAPASLISYAWLQQYGLPLDGSADTTDPDADRLNTWQEWRCGTDPTNASSVLRLLTPLRAANDVNVSWQSVAGVGYSLERSTNLGASPPFLPLATNLTGQAGTTTFTDTNAVAAPPAFYRVGVATP